MSLALVFWRPAMHRRGDLDTRTFLSEAMEAVPAGVVIYDADDRLVLCNSRYLEIDQRLARLLVPGSGFEDLMRAALAAGFYEGIDAASADGWLARRLAYHREPRGTFIQKLSDGRWMQIVERRLPGGGSIAIRTDITYLKLREQQLQESQTRAAAARLQLEEAVEALSEGFALYDSEERLVLCNSKYREIYWRTADSIVPGAHLETLLRLGVARGNYPLSADETEHFIQRRLAQHRSPPVLPVEQKLADGRWLQLGDRRTRDGGIVCVRTDITAMKQAQEALRSAVEAAEWANQAKSRFLATASHDLRQPLHALGMFVAALADRVQQPDNRQIVGNIRLTLDALEALLNALLDISKLDAGVIRPEIREIALKPLLQRLQAECAPQASQQGLRIKVVPCDVSVRSDPVLLESLIRNLVSNALRYTESGGVLIGCRRRGGNIRIEVWDTGIGIPADQIKAIFQEFHRLDDPAGRQAPGVGLGLAIVERTASLLGHRLEVQSVPGRGSVFTVVVPRGRRLPRGGVPAGAARPVARGLDGRSLLVIDDDQAVLAAMRRLLEDWGCRVLTAASGEEAVAALPEFGAPDLIVADYRLRRGTGVEAIAAIRRRTSSQVPAVIVTGDTAPGQIDDSRAAGFPVLHKPVQPAKLRALLSHSLRHAN